MTGAGGTGSRAEPGAEPETEPEAASATAGAAADTGPGPAAAVPRRSRWERRQAAGGTAGADTATVPAADPGAGAGAGTDTDTAAGTGGEEGPGSGRPKKPLLAAAAIAGALLIAVPFLIASGDDEEKTLATERTGSGTVLDDPLPAAPDVYAPTSASPSPSPSPSPSASPEKSEKREAAHAPSAPPTPRQQAAAEKKKESGIVTPPKKSAATTGTRRTTAPAATVAGRPLVNASGKCLSAGAGSDGTQLFLWTCDGSANQKWDFRPDGTVRSVNLCMDVAWGAKENNTVIQVAHCSGNPAQQFYLNSTEDLVARIATKCVDAQAGGTANGTPTVLFDCHGGVNQTWRLG
ncbi:RICIN domain-containing protein [uncultured Streptomyces sp.]|uniref:RICIN domain-containing protein n=1 Tax=uncultured Streptomyces sp. TaxID=174707 RepID=UPI002634F1E1|nr:RICIN domain-containing protein [uncultured Streptomyces sp.]